MTPVHTIVEAMDWSARKAYDGMMLRHFFSVVAAVMLAVLSVTVAAHATVIAAQRPGAAISAMTMDHATMQMDATGMDCCAQSLPGAAHDALCQYSCKALSVLPGGLRDASISEGREARFPFMTLTNWSGRSPNLPERPPKHGLRPV